jgi:hypothetical protein
MRPTFAAALTSAFAAGLLTALLAAPAFAKLPPLPDAAKAAAAETAAKTAWSDKVGLYKACLAMDRSVAAYRASASSASAAAPPPSETAPACTDPGPYVSQITPKVDKPLEASEAHSPAGTATGPPSSKATDAELKGGRK